MQAKAALTYSQGPECAPQTLLKQGAGTLQQAQQTNSDLIQKQAAFDAAEAALTQAKRQLAVLIAAEAQRRGAARRRREAQLAQAEANLSRTVIVAPFEGRVTQLTAAKGGYADARARR